MDHGVERFEELVRIFALFIETLRLDDLRALRKQCEEASGDYRYRETILNLIEGQIALRTMFAGEQ